MASLLNLDPNSMIEIVPIVENADGDPVTKGQPTLISLQQLADWITTAGTGGVQSVVAGTGITVDNTDPQNPVVATST